ncbi:MAG: Ribosomal RNA large subunit methyltransferase H [Flavobacteriales bacterium]|nr:MAG: Ribosomal RNA large subunit methyltransferase H [Flavobacteriales bacterium]
MGKTNHVSLRDWLPEYQKRLSHYVKFEWVELPELKNTKNLRESVQKEEEGKRVFKQLNSQDVLVLFDEVGSQYTSKGMANFLQKCMNAGTKNLIFVIGGPYGFSDEIYKRAQYKISLSAMTFSHQMVRIFVAEQLYRAFSILNNEPYHHE